ncbi:MAG: hypothetical protein VYE40_19965 [Myxococcota bacterium]|jgi:hypothetical protein|nr:hypothetical protein [Myxococcota bacterium]
MDGYYGEPVADVAPQIWWRLYRGTEAVGYRQTISDTELFSTDGYCWKGGYIAHDHALMQTDLRDRGNQRVFHLDRVLMPRISSQPPREAVALVHPTYGTLLWFLESGEVIHIDDYATGYVLVDRVIGSLHGLPSAAKMIPRVLDTYQPRVGATALDVIAFAVPAGAGVLLAGLLMFEAFGYVSFGGVLLGLLLALTLTFYWFRLARGGYTRHWLKSVSWKSAWVGGLCITVGWALFSPETTGPFETTAMMIANTIIVFLATMLSGATNAWIHGGFKGELGRTEVVRV